MLGIFLFFMLIPFTAHAATCVRGYYLNNGECIRCNHGYYCPDENTRIECPRNTHNWYDVLTDQGYEDIGMSSIVYYSWDSIAPNTYGPSDITHCHLSISFATSVGRFLIEPAYTGTEYDTQAIKLWSAAATGYYLSGYYFTSSVIWYYGVKACTNAPEHAHYTGAGTPDDPVKTGGTKDYNDCPWACDDGYGNHDGKCVPLCSAGVRYIRADNGLRINLYQMPYSSPRIVVEYNNAVCYGILAPGAQSGTINVDVGGTTYHVEN